MARGVQFDTYDPAKIEALRERAQPARNLDRKTAPGPAIRECCECGRPACFGEGVALLKGIEGDWFCPRHAPAHLKNPEAAR